MPLRPNTFSDSQLEISWSVRYLSLSTVFWSSDACYDLEFLEADQLWARKEGNAYGPRWFVPPFRRPVWLRQKTKDQRKDGASWPRWRVGKFGFFKDVCTQRGFYSHRPVSRHFEHSCELMFLHLSAYFLTKYFFIFHFVCKTCVLKTSDGSGPRTELRCRDNNYLRRWTLILFPESHYCPTTIVTSKWISSCSWVVLAIILPVVLRWYESRSLTLRE